MTINYLTGVHQGDSLAPLLFVFIFKAAMESLKLTNECKDIIKPKYKYFLNTLTYKPRGRLAGQNTSGKGKDGKSSLTGSPSTPTIVCSFSRLKKMLPTLRI